MNQEDIIKLAREAGFEINCCSLEWHDRIERFAAFVYAAGVEAGRDKTMIESTGLGTGRGAFVIWPKEETQEEWEQRKARIEKFFQVEV